MQKNLFGETQTIKLTINEVAKKINVSSATIRNWIKTGYLIEIKKGIIDENSLNEFMLKIAGKEKLTSRANKSLKDQHDHNALSEFVKNNAQLSWTEIGEQYEQSLSNSYRNKEGIYYTPIHIVQDMLKDIPIDSTTTFLDPCCGSGNFIIEAIKKGVSPENVFGFDIDPNAVKITREKILELTGYDAKKNIQTFNFLDDAHLLTSTKKYDLIFTNPPWGKKLSKQEKEKLSLRYGTGKSVDTSSLFYFATMRILKDDGTLGFLVQEALFNISTFQDTRLNILKNKLQSITDYGKSFKGLVTKACAFILKKKAENNLNVKCNSLNSSHYRNQNSFHKNPKNILNFWATEEEAKAIQHIFELPHKTLAGEAKWALGIVTGNNSKYCKPTVQANHIPIYKGADITTKGLKNVTNYIPNDFSKYQQVAPLSLYNAPEKLIYKFISSQLVFFYDTKQRFILNSANLMIPNKSIGISCKNLATLLSSDFMNWLFRALFRTHKILRGDIEQLPIHVEYFNQYNDFSEKTYLKYLNITKQKNGTYRIEK